MFFLIEIFLVFFLTFINWGVNATGGHWAHQTLFSNDNATLLTTAISHNKGLGVLYKDYWEYRPPIYFMLLDFWTRVFGINLVSLKILESFFRFLIGLAIVFIVRKVFSPFQGLVFSLLIFFTFYSPVFNSWLYSEAYGIFFALAGVLTLIYIRQTVWRFFLAAMCFFVAMETKDTFGGASLAILPSFFYLFIRRNYKPFTAAVFLSVLGVLLSLSLEWLYLKQLDALNAYWEVYSYNTSFARVSSPIHLMLVLLKRYYIFFFSAKEYLSFFHPPIFLLLAIWIFLIIKSFARKWSVKISITDKTIDLSTVLLFSFGSYLGSALVFLLTPHYVLFVLIPTFFIWGLFASSFASLINNEIKFLNKNLIFCFILLFLLLPTWWIYNQYPIIPTNLIKQAYLNFTLSEGDVRMEKYIKNKTTKEDCIIGVYGWKSSELYFYAERKPCSRFFIPNMIDKEWQKKEYRETILKNPPMAIVYSVDGADMNYQLFESEVIDLLSITKNCYQQDMTFTTNGRWPSLVYFPLLSGDQLKTCLMEYGHKAS